MSEPLTTYAPNHLALTSFYESGILEVSKYNTQALYLGLTGLNFTTDETITVGHKHDDEDSRLSWHQVATFPLLNQGAPTIIAAPDEAYDAVQIDTTGFVVLAVLRLFVSPIEASQIVPRIKVSNDNSAIVNCTIKMDFYELDFSTLLLTQSVVFSTLSARNRVWIDNLAVDLSAASPDVDWPEKLPIVCVVSGKLAAATEFVALHEVAFGVTP